MIGTARKVPIFGIFLVCIFPHLDWKQREYGVFFVFNPNAGKYGPEKLRVRTFFTQWARYELVPFCGFNNTQVHLFLPFSHYYWTDAAGMAYVGGLCRASSNAVDAVSFFEVNKQ